MHEFSENIKYIVSDNNKIPGHYILACTLAVTYYQDFHVVDINNVNSYTNKTEDEKHNSNDVNINLKLILKISRDVRRA